MKNGKSTMVLYIGVPRKRDAEGLVIEPLIFMRGPIFHSLADARKWERTTGESVEKIHGLIISDVNHGRTSTVYVKPFGVKIRGEECVITGEERDTLRIIDFMVPNSVVEIRVKKP